MIDLDAAEKLANAATPGPWRWNGCVQLEGPPYERDYGSGVETVRDLVIETDNGVYPPGEADAAFIAASRQLLPALIAEVRRLSDVDAMAGRLKAIVGPLWSEAYCVEVAKGLVDKGPT